MLRYDRLSRERFLDFESCEARALTTLVFVFDGNAFAPARPSILTADAAQILREAGNAAIQLATPDMGPPGALRNLGKQLESLSHGQPIGIVGFSAGGTLALRLAGIKALHVTDVLSYYGPADLRDYLKSHRGDPSYRYIVGHVHLTRAAIDALSGPSDTSAHVVAGYGLSDHTVPASEATASLLRDFPQGQVYDYPGPHGVSIRASPAALDDFLSHL